MTKCNGLQQCQAPIPHTLFGREARGNWDVFVFLQVACEQDEEMRDLKNALGLAGSVLGLAICLIYKNAIQSLSNTNQINDKLFDSKLITLGDYSVMAKISED